MASTLEILRAAREKIADPDRWVKGELAIDGEGLRIETASGAHRGVRWCAVGACCAVAGMDWTTAGDALEAVAGESVVDFNDTHTHAEVLALFDRTIAEQEAARYA